MEAARAAAGRGHRVVLYEKQTRLGGALIEGSALPLKADLRRYLEWAVKSVASNREIKVKLAKEAGIEPGDIVIINTGWHRYYGDNRQYFAYSPGLYREAGEWFAARRVKAVGVDNQALAWDQAA